MIRHERMKPFHQQPVFLLGMFLGLSLGLLALSLLPPRHHRQLSRQRRDIKTIPREPEAKNQPKVQIPSSPGALATKAESPRHDSLTLDLELSREKRRRKSLLHAEILATRGPDAEMALRMTWASAGLTYHVTLGNPQFPSSTDHLWSALRHLCSEPLDKDWYLVVKDSVYVNADRLQEVVLTLSAEDRLVLGVFPPASTYCSLDAGVLFSRQALQSTCSMVERCVAQPPPHNEFQGCLEREAGIMCDDILEMTGSEYAPTPTPATLEASVTLYVGPVPAPDDLYKIHLLFTENRISLIQAHVFWLAQQMDLDLNSKPRPKRNSPDFEQTVLQNHGAILNSTMEPLTEYFDSSGWVYSDSCVVTKENVSAALGFRQSAYFASQYLSSEFGRDVGKQDYFGFRSIKPLSGIEYQFYYIHEDQINKRGYYYDKLYQVNIKQDYEKLRVQEKRIRTVEDITIVTIADDIALLRELLQSLVDNCVRVARTNAKCSVLLLYDTQLFNTDFEMGDLGRVLKSIDQKGVNIRTLDIGAASSFMNNFQRAVVSVPETDNSLIVFLHPKSHITEHFLYRCQANTIPGTSAYFPIPFQQTRDSDRVTSDAGFWKNTDYDTFCIHTQDLQKLLIVPKSPQMLYQFLVSLAKMQVRRMADVGLWREWEEGLCSDLDLDQDSNLQKCQQDFMYRNL